MATRIMKAHAPASRIRLEGTRVSVDVVICISPCPDLGPLSNELAGSNGPEEVAHIRSVLQTGRRPTLHRCGVAGR